VTGAILSAAGVESCLREFDNSQEVDINLVIPDYNKTINQKGIAPLGEVRDNHSFKQLRVISKEYKFSFSTPLKDVPKEAIDMILYGGNDKIATKMKFGSGSEHSYYLANEGLVNMLARWYKDTSSEGVRRWAEAYMVTKTCSTCEGERLKKESLHFKINEKNISQLSQMDISDLHAWISEAENHLSDRQKSIAKDIINLYPIFKGFS